MPCDRSSLCGNSETMRSPMIEYITQQGNSVPQLTLQTSSQNQRQSDDSTTNTELRLTGNESPRSSPKHSPRQSHKKDITKPENAVRDPSPMQLSKSDLEQQDNISQSSDLIQPPELNRSISHESNKDRKESRGSDRVKKKSSWHNLFYSTYKTRSEQLRRYFKDLPLDEKLIGDYSCALQRDILYQGRLYVTQNYVCFYANLFRWEKCVFVKWKDVKAVTKGKTARLFPNAILISTDAEKLFFTTFTARDKAFVMLFRVWQNALMDQAMSTPELCQWVRTVYGDELGLTSEDEDYNYIPPDDKIYPIVKLPTDSLSEPQVFGGGNVDKGGSELGLSATDSTNKSQGSVPSQNDFLSEAIPSPLNIEVDAMTTDFSDNSSETEVNGEEKVKASCSSPHEGRLIVQTELPINVDRLFDLMFTNSKFFYDFHTKRQSTDIIASPWRQSPDSNEQIRKISMVVSVNQPVAPKTANVSQTQVMLPCSVPGQLYSIDDEIVNSGIPYADSFYIVMHYCLEKISKTETSLTIYGDLKFRKAVWSFAKGFIEKATWDNIKDHNECIVEALLAESKATNPKRRKGRRRHRAASSLDHLPSSSFVSRTTDTDGRSRKFIKVSRAPDTDGRGRPFCKIGGGQKSSDGRSNMLICVMLAVLVVLLVLNGFLYYKLKQLEDFTAISGFGRSDMDILKNPPKIHEEWLKILRLHENIHRMGVDKWQEVLRSSVESLKKAEESFHALQGSIKPSYEEVLFRKDKQEL